MNKSDVVAAIEREATSVPPGQGFKTDRFRPADGWGVARLHHAVYGASYPVDTPYLPDRLAEANAQGEILTVVARAESGDVLGQAALYRSSPPNPRLYEYGQMLVLPEYRNSSIAFRLNQYVTDNLMGSDGVDAVYGEAVLNHVVTQKLTKRTRTVETGLEPALMPDGAYEKEGAKGRVGCLMAFRVDRDQRRTIFLPPCWREAAAFLMDGLGLDRDVRLSEDAVPGDARTEVAVQRFDFAGVVRVNVSSVGPDAATVVAEAEAAGPNPPALVQVFLNLGQPWSGRLAEQLRARGYFLGGYLPVWFGDDGLLLQKLSVDPEFEAMNLYSERGKRIRDLVRADWELARAGREKA